jgi:hypothetical protein
VGQEGADPLWQGEDPLAERQRWQHVIGQVGGHLHHAPGVARRADAAALAGEGDEALGGARIAADAGKAMGEDAAAEVGAEVVLNPLRDAVAIEVGGEEGLQVVLCQGVKRRGGRITAAVDGGEAVGPRRCLGMREGTAGSGPAGAGRRGRGHAADGAAAGGATEWWGESSPVEWGLGPREEEREWQHAFFARIERPVAAINLIGGSHLRVETRPMI